MRKDVTVLVLCGLLMLADVVALRAALSEVGPASGGFVVLLQIAAAAVIAGLAGVVAFRKRFRRQKRPASQWRLALAGPSHRLP